MTINHNPKIMSEEVQKQISHFMNENVRLLNENNVLKAKILTLEENGSSNNNKKMEEENNELLNFNNNNQDPRLEIFVKKFEEFVKKLDEYE